MMRVRDLIEELQKFDPETLVVHSTRLMQTREEVVRVTHGKPIDVAWDSQIHMLKGGNWVELE